MRREGAVAVRARRRADLRDTLLTALVLAATSSACRPRAASLVRDHGAPADRGGAVEVEPVATSTSPEHVCAPADRSIEELDGVVLREPAAASADVTRELACPAGTTAVTRLIGVGSSDITDVHEHYCARPDGQRHGPYRARAGPELLARGDYDDGYRHGPWVLRSGAMSGSYERGHRHGPWTSSHRPGALAWTGSFVCGRRVGPFKWWRVDGVRQQEGSFVDDLPDGPWRYFGADGALSAEGSYAAGEKVGAWTYHDDAGNTRVEDHAPADP